MQTQPHCFPYRRSDVLVGLASSRGCVNIFGLFGDGPIFVGERFANEL
jgi:hypothetical protein